MNSRRRFRLKAMVEGRLGGLSLDGIEFRDVRLAQSETRLSIGPCCWAFDVGRACGGRWGESETVTSENGSQSFTWTRNFLPNLALF